MEASYPAVRSNLRDEAATKIKFPVWYGRIREFRVREKTTDEYAEGSCILISRYFNIGFLSFLVKKQPEVCSNSVQLRTFYSFARFTYTDGYYRGKIQRRIALYTKRMVYKLENWRKSWVIRGVREAWQYVTGKRYEWKKKEKIRGIVPANLSIVSVEFRVKSSRCFFHLSLASFCHWQAEWLLRLIDTELRTHLGARTSVLE